MCPVCPKSPKVIMCPNLNRTVWDKWDKWDTAFRNVVKSTLVAFVFVAHYRKKVGQFTKKWDKMR